MVLNLSFHVLEVYWVVKGIGECLTLTMGMSKGGRRKVPVIARMSKKTNIVTPILLCHFIAKLKPFLPF